MDNTKEQVKQGADRVQNSDLNRHNQDVQEHKLDARIDDVCLVSA